MSSHFSLYKLFYVHLPKYKYLFMYFDFYSHIYNVNCINFWVNAKKIQTRASSRNNRATEIVILAKLYLIWSDCLRKFTCSEMRISQLYKKTSYRQNGYQLLSSNKVQLLQTLHNLCLFIWIGIGVGAIFIYVTI